MKKFWIVFAALCAVATVFLLAGWIFLQRLETVAGPVGGVLDWRVDTAYPERQDTGRYATMFGHEAPLMRDVTRALRRAARDDRISGLSIDVAAAPMSWADVEELRDAVGAFRDAGKPVVAWMSFAGTREYVLASAADKVVLAPEGNLMLRGANAELTFLAGTLDKLGMEADYVHVGRYKTAPETYTRTAPSDANREMMGSIVDDHYNRLIDTLASDRGLTAADAAARIDQGLYDALSALDGGLVDEIAYSDDAFEEAFGDADKTVLEDYVMSSGDGRGPRVALVTVEGTIVEGDDGDSLWEGRLAGSGTIVDRLRRATEDDRIAAIVLRVDSPGGSATASDLIWNEVRRAQDAKPLVVSMSDYAASGGYYVSCAADSIFAEPETLTGSIGVFAGKMDRHKMYEKLGVNREFVTRGRNALMFADAARFDDEQRSLLQRNLDAFYDRFVTHVAVGRELPEEDIREVAEGRVWTGEQAVAAGLVDDLGGLERSLASVRALLGLPADAPLHLVTYESRPSLVQRLLARALHGTGAASLAPAPWRDLAASGLYAQAALLDGRPLALLPVRIEFP